jgi:hypothetical protein
MLVSNYIYTPIKSISTYVNVLLLYDKFKMLEVYLFWHGGGSPAPGRTRRATPPIRFMH